jgi:hypothetical protein
MAPLFSQLGPIEIDKTFNSELEGLLVNVG